MYLEVRVEGLDGREGAEDVRAHDALQLCQIPDSAAGPTRHIAPSAPADSAMLLSTAADEAKRSPCLMTDTRTRSAPDILLS